MNIYIIKKDTFEDLEVVGEYGTFHNPVVMYNDKEIVAEYYDIDNDVVLCQSNGCSRCFSKCDKGCRLSSSENTGYAI